MTSREALFSSSADTGRVALPEIGLPLALATCAGVLAVLHMVLNLMGDRCASWTCTSVREMIKLNNEGNFPTWFSSACWLIAAALAALVAASGRRMRLYWAGLAFLCAFLSFDETARFHEIFGSHLGVVLGTKDVLFYNWIIYGFLAVGAVGLIYLPFVVKLDGGTRWRLLLGACIFVGGAIGVEMLGAASGAGVIDLVIGPRRWVAQVTVEETMEMLGIIVIIHAFLHHIAAEIGDITFRVRAK